MKPQRMCTVCRMMNEKEKLFRVVRSMTGIMVDADFRIQGRGAYVCRSRECIENARRRKAFERSFSANVEQSVYDELEALLG